MYSDLQSRLARVTAATLLLALPLGPINAGEPVAEMPAVNLGPSVDSPIPLPTNFWSLPKAERYRYLQEQLDLLDLLAQAAQKRNGIRQAEGRASAGSPSVPAVAGQPVVAVPNAPLRPEPSLPIVQRIHVRNRALVAEAMIPGQGPRTLHQGDEIGGFWTVAEIATDRVVVTAVDGQTQTSLPTPMAAPFINPLPGAPH
jgi:type IV pilus biogenesis protein PilP